MCGRFTLTLDASELQMELDLGDMPPEWTIRYNVAPTQPIAVVRDSETRKVDFMYWGLVPFWASDINIGTRMINARSETLQEKPSFKHAYKYRRCLILADGFYEWARPGGKKGPAIPHYFRRKDKKPFMFAGLWEHWQNPEGSELLSTTIITCPPNQVVKPVHDRMPVILTDEVRWKWLENRPQPELQSMLLPYPNDLLETFEVSKQVSNARNEGSELIAPRQSLF